ncbi:hypothetical protein THARTR1_01919 [Trichoderma harzianum]|uniref:Uncharacterized protein n=1 Tax=Trichoderma harzianum TaxID=5544 RepID=A0A2K0UIY4_TRIHA|nr:hypothetical protein THARTR1_01919 [Trichoderma harzianum]
MPIRNPFARRPGTLVTVEDNVYTDQERTSPGFERVDTVGSKASSALSIRSARSQDTGEYKMSGMSWGDRLPLHPCPRRLSPSLTVGGEEPVAAPVSLVARIDISARSPIAAYDVPARQSLDSARFARMPRSAINRHMEQLPTAEENFEDVGLEDQKQPPRKRGFFSKLTETQEKDSSAQTGVSRFLMPGRKRAQSGQGAELAAMDQPALTSSD